MKEISTPLTEEDLFNCFTQGVYRQLSEHGVEAGYHSASGPNLLFEFIKDFDPRYCHPIGEAISKLKELAQQMSRGDPKVELTENLEKAAAWVYLIYEDIQRSCLEPTCDRAGSDTDPQRAGGGSQRP